MTNVVRRLIRAEPGENGQKITAFERSSHRMARDLYLEILEQTLTGHLTLEKKENELVGNIDITGKFSHFNDDVMIFFWETPNSDESEPRFGIAFCIGVSEGMPLNRYFFRLWASENHFYEMAGGKIIPYYSFELCGTEAYAGNAIVHSARHFNPRKSEGSTDLSADYPRRASLNRINREIELDRSMA